MVQRVRRGHNHVPCYRAEGKNGKLDVEDRRGNENPKLAYLLHWPDCFSGRLGWPVPKENLLELVARITE